MPHFAARMSSKGQLTVPAKVREFLGLETGDIVDFYIDEALRVVRLRARNAASDGLLGALVPFIGQATPVEPESAAADREASREDSRVAQDWREWEEFEAWRRARRTGEAAE